MALPTISIITICYNAEKTIARTLRSIAEQTYPHIEYIVVDGASRDGTLALAKQLAPTAHIYSAPDRGIYDAMNKGLNYATGDYVWFVNAGDALPSPDTVKHITASMDGSMPDVVYGDCMLIDHNDRQIGLRRLRPPRSLSWRSFINGMTVCHQSFIALRKLSPEYDMRYRFSSDVDWCIRVMKGAKTFHRIDEPISLYLYEGTTTANRRKSLLERFDIMRRHYGLIPTLWAHLRFLFR